MTLYYLTPAEVPAYPSIAAALTAEAMLQREFDAVLDEIATEPATATVTLAGEFLNDHVLADCCTTEFPDADLNTMAATLLALCPEFRAMFGRYHLNAICYAVEKERAERWEESKRLNEID